MSVKIEEDGHENPNAAVTEQSTFTIGGLKDQIFQLEAALKTQEEMAKSMEAAQTREFEVGSNNRRIISRQKSTESKKFRNFLFS